MRIVTTSCLSWFCLATLALGQGNDFATSDPRGPRPDQPLVSRIRIGVVVVAGTVCRGINATTPVPQDWPEQQVKIVAEDITPSARSVTYRGVGTNVKQMVVGIPSLPAGDEARSMITFEVTRRAMLPPEDTSIFIKPNLKKLKPEMRTYLGPSPQIETQNARFKQLVKELTEGRSGTWQQVEALYDGTRERVQFRNGPLKGAVQALRDGYGDAEELCSVFIALCRSFDVPARMVWVQGHVYVEFYLETEDGTGFWLPCQVAGTREFGGITERRPILMKGDNFMTPERPGERQRFVAPWLTGAGGKPQVRFVRELIDTQP